MKNSVTKFDINSAFKALEDIEYPTTKGLVDSGEVKGLVEHFKPQLRSNLLVEEYYNIASQNELEEAKESREAEIAKAKLARIEKIVDLDAKTEDDILPAYVGKFIIQCPQCMTLFYKNENDIEYSAEDEEIVNEGEICQHCGNDSGYQVIGKVAEVKEDEMADFTGETPEETTEEEISEEPSEEEIEEEQVEEEQSEEAIDVDASEEVSNEDVEELPEINLDNISAEEMDFEEDEEEIKTESLNKAEINDGEADTEHHSENLSLNEASFADLKNKLSQKLADTKEIHQYKKELSEIESIIKSGDEVKTKALAQKRDLELKRQPLFKEINVIYLDENKKEKREPEPGKPAIANLATAAGMAISNSKGLKVCYIQVKPINETEFKNLQKYKDGKLVEDYYTDLKEAIINEQEKQNAQTTDENEAALDAELENETINTTNTETAQVEAPTENEVAAAPANDNLAKANAAKAKNQQILKVLRDAGIDTTALTANKNQKLKEIRKELFGESLDLVDDEDDIDGENIIEESVEDIAQKIADFSAKLTDSYMSEESSATMLTEASERDIDAMLDSKEFKTPVSDAEVKRYLQDDLNKDGEKDVNEFINNIEEIEDKTLTECITKSLTEVYENVDNFILTNCELADSSIIIEGLINFKSGKQCPTKYIFTEAKLDSEENLILRGLNEDLSSEGDFRLAGKVNEHTLISESLSYKYTINDCLVEGLAK